MTNLQYVINIFVYNNEYLMGIMSRHKIHYVNPAERINVINVGTHV